MPYQGFPFHLQQHLKGCHDQGAWRMRTGLLQRPKWRTRGQNLHWRRPVGDKDVGMAPRKRLMKERETLPAPGARPIAGPRTAPACRRSGRCHHTLAAMPPGVCRAWQAAVLTPCCSGSTPRQARPRRAGSFPAYRLLTCAPQPADSGRAAVRGYLVRTQAASWRNWWVGSPSVG